MVSYWGLSAIILVPQLMPCNHQAEDVVCVTATSSSRVRVGDGVREQGGGGGLRREKVMRREEREERTDEGGATKGGR